MHNYNHLTKQENKENCLHSSLKIGGNRKERERETGGKKEPTQLATRPVNLIASFGEQFHNHPNKKKQKGEKKQQHQAAKQKEEANKITTSRALQKKEKSKIKQKYQLRFQCGRTLADGW